MGGLSFFRGWVNSRVGGVVVYLFMVMIFVLSFAGSGIMVPGSDVECEVMTGDGGSVSRCGGLGMGSMVFPVVGSVVGGSGGVVSTEGGVGGGVPLVSGDLSGLGVGCGMSFNRGCFPAGACLGGACDSNGCSSLIVCLSSTGKSGF